MKLKVAVGFLLFWVILLGGGWYALQSRYVAVRLKNLIADSISSQLQSEASIGDLSIDPLQNKISLSKLVIAAPGYSPFFTLGSAEIEIDPWPLLGGTLYIKKLTLDRPELTLAISKKGGSNLPTASSGGGSSSKFSVQIDEAQIRNGSAQLSFPGVFFSEVNGISVNLTQKDSVYDISVRAESGYLDVPRAHEKVKDLVVSGRYQDGSFFLKELSLSTDGLTAQASGAAEKLQRAQGDGSLALPIALLGKALGLSRAEGSLSASFSMSGDLSSPSAAAQLLLKDTILSWYHIGSPSISLRIDGDVLRIVSVRIPIGDGEIDIAGSVKLRYPLPIELHFQAKNLQYAEVLESTETFDSWIVATVNNSVQLEGKLLDGFILKTRPGQKGHGVFTNFQMLPHSFRKPTGETPYVSIKEIKSEADVTVLPDRILLENGVNSFGSVQLQYSGFIAYDYQLDLRFQGHTNLAEFGPISEIPFTGVGSFKNGRMYGTLYDPMIVFDADLAGFSVDGYPLGDIKGKFDYRWPTISFPNSSGVYKSVSYRAQGEIDFSQEEMPCVFETEVLQGDIHDVAEIIDAKGYIPPEVKASMRATTKVTGPLYTPDTVSQAHFENISAYGEKLKSADLNFRYRVDGDFHVDKGTLYDENGSIELSGSYLANGEFKASLQSTLLSSKDLDVFNFASLGLSTDYSLSVDAEGTFEDPRLNNGTLRLENTSLRGIALEPSSLNFVIAFGSLSTQGTVLGGAELSAEAQLRGQLPFDVKLSLPDLSLQHLFPTLTGVSAEAASTEISLSGELKNASAMTGQLTIGSLSGDAKGIEVQSEAPVQIQLKDGTLRIPQTTLLGGGGAFAVNVAGEYQLTSQKATLSMASAFDLAAVRELPIVAAALPSDVTAITGQATISSTLNVSPEDYNLFGKAYLEDFSFSLTSLPHPIEDLDVEMTFSQNTLWIDSLMGTFAGGSLGGEGEIALEDFTPTRIRMSAALSGAEIRRPQDGISASLDAKMTLEGPLEKLRMEGVVDINNFLYNKDVEFVPTLGDLLVRKAAAPPVIEESKVVASSLFFDIELKSSGTLRVENNLLHAELQVDSAVRPFHIQGDLNNPELFGNIVLLRDEEDPAKVTLRDKELTVSRAVFDFDGPLDPNIDIVTETKVRDVDITLRATGTAQKPQILYSSNPSLAEEDIILLVTLGVTRREVADLNTSSLSFIAPELLSQLTGVDEQVNRILPEKVELNLTTGFSEVENSFVPKLQVKWDPSDELRFRATSNVLSLGQENSAEFLWNFEDNFSLSGSWDQQGDTIYQGFSVGDVGLDLKWRLEF